MENVVIPVQLIINENPIINVIPNCFTFDTLRQHLIDTSEITIYNPSCSELDINNIQANLPFVSFENTNFIVGPYDSLIIEIYSNPDTVYSYTDTITVY
ncbi:MAG: hypothetical protein ACPG4Y_10765, partial [Chitinophagales bacterium]